MHSKIAVRRSELCRFSFFTAFIVIYCQTHRLSLIEGSPFQSKGRQIHMQDYIVKDNKRLRFGYTTGSCAAGAAKAAAEMLLHGGIIEQVSILTPKGTELNLCVEEIETTDTGVSCYIRKDSGDDPDVTNGIRVYAEVSRTNDMGMIELSGGIGVGRITKPGLACPVGEAAINPVPRRMIEAEVRRVAELYDYKEGLRVTISVP